MPPAASRRRSGEGPGAGPAGRLRRPGEIAREDGTHVVRLSPEDWRSYAELRVAMLAHAPEAFWSRLADVEGRTEQQWRHECDDRTLQARLADGTPVGTLTVLSEDSAPGPGLRPAAGDALLVAVYVVPGARGSGTVDLLLEAAHELARDELGAGRMVLQVHEHNRAARRAYERHGYVLTGTSLAHPHQPDRVDLEMVRPL